MKLVYTHENKLLVENAKNILTEEGIDCTLKNEFAQGAIGDLAPIQAWPELWVLNDEEENKAKEILASLQNDAEGLKWKCSKCGEVNEANFHSCWNCQEQKTL